MQLFDEIIDGSGKKFFVLVVHGHDGEEFSTPRRIVMDPSDDESIILGNVGVAE